MSTTQDESRGAFTLVEMLVVVAIIALLISLLLPAFSRAKQAAQAAVCSGQLRQNGVMMTRYATDSRMHFGYKDMTANPPKLFWADFFLKSGYLSGNARDVLVCPSHAPRQYSRNYQTYGFRWDFWPSGVIASEKSARAGFGQWAYVKLRRIQRPAEFYPMMDSSSTNSSGTASHSQKSRLWPKGATRWTLAHQRHFDLTNSLAFDGHVKPLGDEGLKDTNVTTWFDANLTKIGQ